MMMVMVVMVVIKEAKMISTKIKYLLFFVITLSFFSGCTTKTIAIDKDRDHITDYKDVCKSTPIGAKVDKYGCAIDSDFDGVIDLYDKCPNTTASQLVNKYGCPIREL